MIDGDQRFCFRHALLREALYDDLLPGERGDLHLTLAARLEEAGGRVETGTGELERTAAIAGHYAAAGDQPAALRTTVTAARAAEHAVAFGEAADLAQRALELWPRVADPEGVAGIDHVELLAGAARALSLIDERPRAETLLREALGELDPEREPARYAVLLARLSRILWSLNRGREAVAGAERALAMVPDDDPDGVRPLMLAWLARVAFLRGRHRPGDGGRRARARRRAGDRRPRAETEVLNTLGMARVALQHVDDGVALLRQAIAVARETGDGRRPDDGVLRTSPTCWRSPGAPRRRWRRCARACATRRVTSFAACSGSA